MNQDNQKIQFPPFLQSGDTLHVIAPCGRLRETELHKFKQGLEIWQKQDYKIELSEQCSEKDGYLAGNDDIRRQALKQAWENPECKAILCARGGYGSARLLEDWQWQNISSPKWLIGFSDVTGLLWSLFNHGIASIHGSVLTTFAQESNWSKQRLFNLLKGNPLEALQGKGWGNGKAKGLLLPANLTVATHLLATPICPDFNNVILALEDVQEAPYKIDRMLTQWRMMGIFQQVKGIALGRFSGCDAPQNTASWSVEEVLKNRLGDLNLPIVSDLPFGHDGINAALIVGSTVEIDANQGTLLFM